MSVFQSVIEYAHYIYADMTLVEQRLVSAFSSTVQLTLLMMSMYLLIALCAYLGLFNTSIMRITPHEIFYQSMLIMNIMFMVILLLFIASINIVMRVGLWNLWTSLYGNESFVHYLSIEHLFGTGEIVSVIRQSLLTLVNYVDSLSTGANCVKLTATLALILSLDEAYNITTRRINKHVFYFVVSGLIILFHRLISF